MKAWVHGLDFHVQLLTIFDTHDFAFEISLEKRQKSTHFIHTNEAPE